MHYVRGQVYLYNQKENYALFQNDVRLKLSPRVRRLLFDCRLYPNKFNVLAECKRDIPLYTVTETYVSTILCGCNQL